LFLFNRKARQVKKSQRAQRKKMITENERKKMITENESPNKTISLTIKVNRQINLFA